MTPIIHCSAPVVHSVQFYHHDEALIARLCGIISSAVGVGNSVLIVATEEHRRQLVEALEKRINDPQGLVAEGRLNLLDAQDTLSSFMVNGMPDRKLFFASIGELVSRARSSAWNAQRGLTVFGEMVAVLWADRNHSGALALEELWNELLNDRTFHLHCAYPRALFDAQDRQLMAAICESHSHVVGQTAAA
jgi:hypothetical protein